MAFFINRKERKGCARSAGERLLNYDSLRLRLHHPVIYGEKTQKKAMKIAYELIEAGANGIILGCTELPSVINSSKLPVRVFDSNEILALSCLNIIKGSSDYE